MRPNQVQQMTPKPRNRKLIDQTGKVRANAPRLIENLVVLRESGQYDKLLMAGMIAQTCAKVKDLPGSDELAAAGVDIFENPGLYGATLKRSGGSRIVLFNRGGTLYFCSMGSASREDSHDKNAFVTALIEVITTYRPNFVWTVAFTRLIRNSEYSGDLLKAMSENVEKLYCESDINPSSIEGKLQFNLFGMISATEREYIVRRHTAGRINQWRNNRWIPTFYPVGYTLDSDGRIIIDKDMEEKVRQMLPVLANNSLSATQKIKALGGIGITTQNMKRSHGPKATIANARNPSQVIHTLMEWVNVYRSGKYTLQWANPFPGVLEIGGVEVNLSQPNYFKNGFFEFEYQLPLPENGWADDQTLTALELVATSKEVITGASSHKNVGPLSGLFHFTEKNYEYATLGGHASYKLVRRLKDPEREYSGWKYENSAKLGKVATINRRVLHSSIAAGIISAVANGVPANLDTARFLSTTELPTIDPAWGNLRKLNRDLIDANKELERATRNVRKTEDDGLSTVFIEDMKRSNAEIKRLTAEIAECEKVKVKPMLSSSFDTNASMVAYAIAALANTERMGDQALRQALRTIISNEKMTVKGKTVTWSLNIELPHPQGTVLLGPITGTVPNIQRKAKVKRSAA